MTRPSPAQLSLLRSNLPARRVAPALQQTQSARPVFSTMLQAASQQAQPPRVSSLVAAKPQQSQHVQFNAADGPAPMTGSEILRNASQYMDVPYVWGGNSASGLDCSAFISKAWGIARHTTDNLSQVARPVSKDELQAGDALNLTTGADPEGDGHVRLFEKWANPEHTKMSVYEETPPKSIHHVINWDPKYQPMRRLNVTNA